MPKKPKTITAYMCGTDFTCEAGHTVVTTYASVESMKSMNSCWEECGIVEVEIRFKKLIEEEKSNHGK